jgi:DNA repair exonuclease SbcCD ATPase subunit
MPALQKEGLPYWIFWGMLLVILLLLLFIFLRDRKLRLRLSSFFAGARRRSILLRLQFILKREEQKKEVALQRLGEKAWDSDIIPDSAAEIKAALEETVKKRGAAQMEWKNTIAEMERLHKQLEESNAQFEEKLKERRAQKLPLDERLKKGREEERALKKLPPGGETHRQLAEVRRELTDALMQAGVFERQIRELEMEKSHSQREIAREIHTWKKRKERIQEHIKEIEALQRDFYLSLGRLLEEIKVESQELKALYAEIEVINERLETLGRRIESVGGR